MDRFNRDILTSSLRTEHTKKIKQRFADTPMGKTESISRFLKLNLLLLMKMGEAATKFQVAADIIPKITKVLFD